MSSTSASVPGRNAISLFMRVVSTKENECSKVVAFHHKVADRVTSVVNHLRSEVQRLVNKTCKTNDVRRAGQRLDECTTRDGNSGFPLARNDVSALTQPIQWTKDRRSPVYSPKDVARRIAGRLLMRNIFTRFSTRTRFQLTITSFIYLHWQPVRTRHRRRW